MYPYNAQTEPQSCGFWRVGDAVEALRSSIARNAFVEAEEEDAWSTDPAWTTRGSDEIGEFVAKRFMGKMYLGQVLAWRRRAPWSPDPDKLWYLVGTLLCMQLLCLYALRLLREAQGSVLQALSYRVCVCVFACLCVCVCV